MVEISFDHLAEMLQRSLRGTYGDSLLVETLADNCIFATEKEHGFVLVSIDYATKKATLCAADYDIQALGPILKGLGFEVMQSHDGRKRIL